MKKVKIKMKIQRAIKFLVLTVLLFSAFSSFAYTFEQDDIREEFVRIISPTPDQLIKGKIDTSSALYKEIEKKYSKQITSPLTLSQSLETKKDDDPDTHPNPDKLNLTQFWAIYGYTTGDYVPLNKALRSKNPVQELEKEPKLINQVIVLRAALQKMKSFKGLVYRGTHLKTATLAKHKIGEIVSYAGFLSTSTSREACENFVGNVLFVIHAKNGKAVRNYSQMPQEDEILFDHNSKFKILKKKKIKIEFIDTPIVDEIEIEEI
jgi:hypothetical protein